MDKPHPVYIGAIDQTLSGKVTEVGGVAEATTRAFTVKIELNNPQGKIRPGMNAEIQIGSSHTQNTLSIPATALLRTPEGESYVYVVDSAKKKAFVRNVSLGQMINDRIEILSGLQGGEQIVTGGQHKLTNGTSIK